jgi:hypothetical protein
VSTLFSSIKSTTIVATEALLIVYFVSDVIPTSAKFLSPVGWRILLTGSINFSYSNGLLIVYDKF